MEQPDLGNRADSISWLTKSLTDSQRRLRNFHCIRKRSRRVAENRADLFFLGLKMPVHLLRR